MPRALDVPDTARRSTRTEGTPAFPRLCFRLVSSFSPCFIFVSCCSSSAERRLERECQVFSRRRYHPPEIHHHFSRRAHRDIRGQLILAADRHPFDKQSH